MGGYSRLLKKAAWQKRRLEIFQRDSWACVDCGRGIEDEIELHVHHSGYIGKPWQANDSQLHTLCSECHEKKHDEQVDVTDQTHDLDRQELRPAMTAIMAGKYGLLQFKKAIVKNGHVERTHETVSTFGLQQRMYIQEVFHHQSRHLEYAVGYDIWAKDTVESGDLLWLDAGIDLSVPRDLTPCWCIGLAGVLYQNASADLSNLYFLACASGAGGSFIDIMVCRERCRGKRRRLEAIREISRSAIDGGDRIEIQELPIENPENWILMLKGFGDEVYP